MKRGTTLRMSALAYAIARIGLGAIFIYAAILKIGAPQNFADALASYHLLPRPIINLVALGLPPFEFACGLLLLTRQFRATGLLSIIGLLGIFFVAILWVVARNLPVDCGCFGTGHSFDSSPGISMARDAGLLLCAVLAYRHELRRSVPALGRSKIHPQLQRIDRTLVGGDAGEKRESSHM